MKIFGKMFGFALGLLLASGCCDPCDKGDLGDFLLQNGTEDWLVAAGDPSRTFTDQNGQTLTFTYSPLEGGFTADQAGCDPPDDCGQCCFQLRSAFLYTRLSGPNGARYFDLRIEKDFVQHTVDDPPAAITDYLRISSQDQLSCELFEIPSLELTNSVLLNGQVYTEVFSCERSDRSGATDEVVAWHFNRQRGIVGFEWADGTVWSLDL